MASQNGRGESTNHPATPGPILILNVERASAPPLNTPPSHPAVLSLLPRRFTIVLVVPEFGSFSWLWLAVSDRGASVEDVRNALVYALYQTPPTPAPGLLDSARRRMTDRAPQSQGSPLFIDYFRRCDGPFATFKIWYDCVEDAVVGVTAKPA